MKARFYIGFFVLFFGFTVFSPGINASLSSNIARNTIELDEVEQLQVEDIRYAEKYLPLIMKYVNDDDRVAPLVLAVMKAESNFSAEAESRKGALGLMQLMPTTALDEYRKTGLDAPLPKLKQHLISQPELNIALGVRHLQNLESRLEGIENPEKFRKLVIASYNAGIHRVKRAFKCKGFRCYKYKANRYSDRFFNNSLNSLPAETRNYLQNVEHYFRLYRQVISSLKAGEPFTA